MASVLPVSAAGLNSRQGWPAAGLAELQVPHVSLRNVIQHCTPAAAAAAAAAAAGAHLCKVEVGAAGRQVGKVAVWRRQLSLWRRECGDILQHGGLRADVGSLHRIPIAACWNGLPA